MKDEKITITIRIGDSGTMYIYSDRKIFGFMHTVFTYGIKIKSNGEMIKKSYRSTWALEYFKNYEI